MGYLFSFYRYIPVSISLYGIIYIYIYLFIYLYSFSLGAESTPGPWYGRKEYVTEKSIDTSGNQSRDYSTSSAAP